MSQTGQGPADQADALAEAKAAEAQAHDDAEKLGGIGFMALRDEVGKAAASVQALSTSTLELVIRQAERRREELVDSGEGDPASVDLELRVFRILLDTRRELLNVAKSAQAQADLRAGANGGKGLKDRLPKRGGR